ncbi:hypothetical protein TNCV_2068951 [Trichonephila clavipes]|uniref:Uncharacterized protein n=1 Tax=Trichonephila clavipes TaxID=2585209 RepID=A0A8X6W2W1_TRICX|nr:hypothetical protein TNCV_2068951 [Trichonephila clavipes]
MVAVDFLFHENPPTCAGVELATLGHNDHSTEDTQIEVLMHVKSLQALSPANAVLEVRRGSCQLLCRPCHMSMVQNYEVGHQNSLRVTL